jgi:hypothetical protein
MVYLNPSQHLVPQAGGKYRRGRLLPIVLLNDLHRRPHIPSDFENTNPMMAVCSIVVFSDRTIYLSEAECGCGRSTYPICGKS